MALEGLELYWVQMERKGVPNPLVFIFREVL